MGEKNRRATPKGMLERMTGKKIETELLPAIHKVQIMEYLLTCTVSELKDYEAKGLPIFVLSCVNMLAAGDLRQYIDVLNRCRRMAREDTFNAK